MTDTNILAPLQSLSSACVDLVAKVATAIVSVNSRRSRSSGFIWRPGLIVTAEQALTGEGEIAITLAGGETLATQLVGRDPTTDIALLRVDRSGPGPALLTAASVSTGALAMAVGAEEGAPTVTLGLVSRATGPWRSLRGGEIDARIELDLRLRQSSEGGLATDAAGQAIGMVVLGPRQRALVIPTATIERVAAKLESHGRIGRGYLGLGLQAVAIEGGEGSGAMVMSVDPQGPAVKAGIHQGDILVSWNNEPIGHVQSLLRTLGPESIGQKVTLGVRRAGETRQFPLTIAERPAA
jgi:S1-C subfamily serine protease